MTIADPGSAAKVSVWADEKFKYWQVFSGDTLHGERFRRSVAIEPMTCPPDAFRTGRDLIVLAPGETLDGLLGHPALMEFDEVVRRRRMIRRYDPDRPVPPELVDKIVRHGLRAPSAGFSQGWGFLVLTEPDDRDRYWSATTTGAADRAGVVTGWSGCGPPR